VYQDGVSSTPTNAEQQIEQALAEPARARDSAMEVQQRPIPELIEADKHLRRVQASRGNPFGAIKKASISNGRPGGLP
jgi:hypothetical protein